MTQQTQPSPPQDLLHHFRKLYPHLFDAVAQYRRDNADAIPAYCYCPSLAAYSYIIGLHYPGTSGINSIEALLRDTNTRKREAVQVAAETAAIISAWRMGQGIYKFDDTLAQALTSTPTDKIPGQILMHLPEWCVYIETPWCDKSEGFFAMIDQDREPVLRLFFLRHKNYPSLYPLPLTAESIQDAMDMRLKTAQELAEHIEEGAKVYGKFGRDGGELLHHLPECISLLLYICSTEPDYRGSERPSNPRPVRVKRGERIFPASSPRVWEIGYSIGEKLREAATMEGRRNIPEERNAPHPHLRRAHWHTYRVGKERQGYRIRWVHPILVGFNNNGGEE